MGEVIRLDERRRRRWVSASERAYAPARAEFLFDLACPLTYLAAERVDRAFEIVTWTPASSVVLRGSARAARRELDEIRAIAEARADALRLPLAWPERWPAQVPEAMRVAHYAASRGRGGAFVIRAARLAFGGGFDLNEPDAIATAGLGAGLSEEECEQARREARRDSAIQVAARLLLSSRAHLLPALRVGERLFWGEERVAEAAASARKGAATAGRCG